MKINGISGSNAQMGQMGMNQATDSYSRNIQNQIGSIRWNSEKKNSRRELPRSTICPAG